MYSLLHWLARAYGRTARGGRGDGIRTGTHSSRTSGGLCSGPKTGAGRSLRWMPGCPELRMDWIPDP